MSTQCEIIGVFKGVNAPSYQFVVPTSNAGVPDSGRLSRIDRALRVMEESPLQSIELRKVAFSVSLSESHFRFLFRKQVGMPFHQYLIGLRMQRADALLRSSSYKISEIMSIVGITDRSHFVRDYKRVYGTSPGAVRRVARAGLI